jgi:ABC-2 type transport system ATP-binding protein
MADSADIPLIEFRNVSKLFDKKEVLHDIGLKIGQGDIFGIIGVSGAGKTTLLRILVGFYKIDKGSILLYGKDASKDIDKIKKFFGFTSQDTSFYEKLTVHENLEYFGRLYRLSKEQIKENSKNILSLVELSYAKDMLAKNLSGGMQRRLDIACSMMHNPKILILDEPDAGLDPLLRKHIWKLIKNINSMGTTIIISSHLLNEIEDICTKIAIINQGSILAVDSPQSLKAKYSENEELQLQSFPGEYDHILDLLRKKGIAIESSAKKDNKLIVYAKKAKPVLAEILSITDAIDEKIISVDVSKPSIVEVFESLTQKAAPEAMEDHYEQLKESIKALLQHGYAKEEIEHELVHKGYSKKTIMKIMGEVA